jgi:hypothetical protein
LWYTPESVFTQTIPLPEGGGVFDALEAGVDFAGAAVGAGAFELPAGGGVDAAGVEAEAEPDVELALELGTEAGASALVFLLRVFLVEDVDAFSVAGAFDESVAAAFVLASTDVFFDRDFFESVDVSGVGVDAVDASLEADLEDLEDLDFLVPAASVVDPAVAEVSAAADFEDFDFFVLAVSVADPEVAEVSADVDFEDFFDLLEVVLPLDAEESVADESDDAAFFLDLLAEVPELPVELSVALASELAVVFLDFFLLVVLLLLLASGCC